MQHVLICALILAVLLYKNQVNCETEDEEIIIVGNNVCVTNGSSAIIFNPPIEDTIEHVTVSELFPPLGDSISFTASNWDISNSWKTGPWKIVNSIGYLDDIVTDSRWENFSIYRNYSLNYPKSVSDDYFDFGMPGNTLTEDFGISFSARLEYEGQIYLCDMDCIRISLQPHKIGIERCNYNKTFQQECQTIDEEDITENILDQDLWMHFRIEASKRELTVVHSGMEYLDFNINIYEYVTPRNLLFTSPLGFWKIHSYDFLYTDEYYNDKLGPKITPIKNQICIDFFTVMCKYCRLQISIRQNQGVRLFNRVYRTQDEKWTRVLIRLDDVKDYVYLHVMTIGLTKGQFWALDDIKQCTHTHRGNQYRFIKTDQPNSPCQKVGLTSHNIWNEPNYAGTSEPYLMCGHDEVGTLCVPCQIFTNSSKCHNFRYCEYVEYKTVCRCVSDDDCVKYDNPIKFNYSLKLVKSGPQSCQMSVDFQPEPPLRSQTEYRKENETEWRRRKSFNKITNEKTYTVGNLEPDTTYEIRIVIDGHYVDDDAEIVQCHTSCKYLEPDDVSIIPTSNIAVVHIRFDPKINCPLSNYYYTMNNRSVNLSESFYISNYQQYGLVIGCVHLPGCDKPIFKDFPKLNEEVAVIPNEVRNINVTFLGSNSVNLSWDAPYKSAINQKYDIKYYLFGSNKCGTSPLKDQKWYSETTNSSYVILRHLQPISTYQGMVYAINQQNPGPLTYFSFTTKASDKISKNELVKIQFIRKTSNEIMVKPSQLPCERYQGEHFYFFEANCSKEWCDKKSPTINVQWENDVIIKDLYPFVSYTIKLRISRTWNGAKILSDMKIIQTDSSDPNRVTIEITTSGETIGLRWKLPYPPTGILDGYNLRISGGNNTFSMKTNGTPCLWPGYHCVKIEKLVLDTDYDIKLSARNKGRNYRTVGEIKVISKEGAPDAPDLCSASWYPNNTLRVSWNHPNNTRGVLRQFLIQINSKIFPVDLTSEEDYKFTYKYELQSNQLPYGIWCSYFPIHLQAVNDFGNNSAKFWVYSPPLPISVTIKTILVTETNLKVRINWTEGVVLKGIHLKLRKNSQAVVIASCRLNQVKAPVEYDFYKNCSVKLEPRQKYTVNVIIVNDCSGQKKEFPRTQFLTLDVTTKGTGTEKYAALVLLILPLILFLYCYFKKRKGTTLVSSKSYCNEIAFEPKSRKFAILTKGNLSKVTYSKRIKINNLEKYIKKSIRSGELQQQFNCFKGFKALCENVLQQDDSQKTLITYKRSIGEFSKYVDVSNASFIDGYNAAKAYIVTQVPKQCALQKFWKMVWQENIENIVTVINLNETGKMFWPGMNEEKHYGLIKVRYESNSVFVNFEMRIFEIYFGNEIRKLTQWHFTSWPEQGTPLYSHNLSGFLKKVSGIPYKTNSPILVHCSGGIGVSGTIILIDTCLRMAAEEAAVDFLARFKILRQLRPDLVENVEQYKLAHLVVYECVFKKMNAMKCNDNMPKVVEVLLTSDAVQAEMEHLEDMIWLDDAVESTIEVKEEVLICPGKNRFNDIVPGKYRVILPSTNDTSSYINAVHVNGSSNKLKYIVTQQPLPNTIGDFWRMVIENKSTVIVSLNEIDPHDKTICQFWPEEGYDLPVDFLNISHVKEQQKKHYKIVTLRVQPQLTAIGDFNLNIIQVLNWKAGTLLPDSVEELLSFEEEAEVLSNRSCPTIVTCYDGATACGLYLAMALVMEKMKLEKECDVSLAVRTVRHYRKQFVKDKIQYEFLYKAAVAYLEEFKPYPKIVTKQ